MTAVLERQLSNAPGSSVPRPQTGEGGGSNTVSASIPESSDAEQRELQQALEASRQADAQAMDTSSPSHNTGSAADQEQRELEQAIAESQRQAEVDERRRREIQTYSGSGGVSMSSGGTIPGAYHGGNNGDAVALGATLPINGNSSVDGLSGRMQTMDLMDEDSGQRSSQHRPLEPLRTGTNNPFNPVNEGPSSPFSAGPRASNNPFENPAYENADGAGSSRTSYAPPSHPPPGWQNQAAANSFLQPQRVSDQPPPVAPKPPRPQSNDMGSSMPRGGILMHQLGLTQSRQGDDPSAQLKKYDMVILVDDSGSMAGGRWRDTRMALMEVAEQAAEHDTDGIDVYFINDPTAGEGIKASLPLSER